MGRVDGDGAAELLHLGNAEHVDDEIVVAKAGAALAQDYADICSFTDLGDDVLCIPRCDELGFLDLDDPSRCGSGLGGGDNQISLAAQESRDLDDVGHVCDGFGLTSSRTLRPAMTESGLPVPMVQPEVLWVSTFIWVSPLRCFSSK